MALCALTLSYAYFTSIMIKSYYIMIKSLDIILKRYYIMIKSHYIIPKLITIFANALYSQMHYIRKCIIFANTLYSQIHYYICK